MNRFSTVLLLSLVAATTGYAQDASAIDFSVSSGYAVPSSPMTFANYWKMQYGGSLGVGLPLSPSVTLVGSAEYYRFTLRESGVADRFDTKYMRDIWIFADVTMSPVAEPSSILTLALGVRVRPSDMNGVLVPYAIAGGGVMRFALSEIALPTTSIATINSTAIAMTAERRIVGGTETAAFLQGGVGFDLDVTESFRPFLEARYVFGFANGVSASYIPLTAGVRMHF